MKVFVTGGAGFIGSYLVERLLAEGHEVDIADNLSSGSLSNLADARLSGRGRMSFNQMDVRAPDLVDLVNRCRPEVIYHLAAASDARASVGDPLTDADVNLLGSLRVLEAARLCGAQKVVFTTSATHVYGDVDPAELPVKESHPQRPLTPHGVSKRAVVEYLHVYRETHNLEFTTLALASVYGPRQDPTSGTGVVAAFAGRLLSAQACTIHGDGSQTRDFVYIDDAVDALARASGRGGGLMVNVGTGTETTINDLYRLMAVEVGVDHPALRGTARSGEPNRFRVDPGRAAIHLGWKPWTRLEDGIASVVDWVRSTRPATE